MADLFAMYHELEAKFREVPFNPFRRSGQGVRQPYPPSFERVEFTAEDGTPLVGMLAMHRDGRPHPAIITSHGIWMMKEVDALVDMAEFYHAAGWHVLVFDFQGHGESAKLSDAPYTMGWKEAGNFVGAATFLRGQGDIVSSVALMGYSLAGAAALLASAHAPGVADCLVIGSPPAKQEPHFIMSHIDKWLRIAKTDPVQYFNSAGAYYGISGEEVRRLDESVDALRQASVPVLFVQTEEDDFIPPPDQEHLAEAARANPNVLFIRKARGGHGVELYLNDRYWVKAVTAAYLKAVQAPALDYVSAEPTPPLDLQLIIEPGWDDLLLVTVWLRNSQREALRDVELRLGLLPEPAPAWMAEPPQFGQPVREGAELRWQAEAVPGSGELVGPFTIALPVSAIPAGARLRTRAAATWSGPVPGNARSNEASYSKR